MSEVHEHLNKTVVSAEGMKKMEEKLQYLTTVRRAEVAEQISVARGFGDLSENAEYDEAKNEQSRLEAEILELEAAIRNAVVISDDETSNDKVNLGAKVKVYDEAEKYEEEYRVVGPSEADPMNNIISTESPLGAALMGKKVGDMAVVLAPDGEIRLRIMAISR